MLKYIKQNKQVICMAIAVFIVSMSALLFFTGSNPKIDSHEIKADLLHGSSHNVEQTVGPKKESTQNHDTPAEVKNEQTFRKVANNFTDSIVILNLDGSIDPSSQVFLEKLGYHNNVKDGLFFSLLNPEDFSAFLGAFGKVLQDHQAIQIVGPYRLRDAHGQYFVHVGTVTPYMVNEKLEKVIFTFKDITAKLEHGQEAPKDITPEPKHLQNDEHSIKRLMADRV